MDQGVVLGLVVYSALGVCWQRDSLTSHSRICLSFGMNQGGAEIHLQ